MLEKILIANSITRNPAIKKYPGRSITPETRFLADLQMNSLDIMDMVGQLEDEFDVVIATEDLNEIFTVQDLIDYLNEIM